MELDALKKWYKDLYNSAKWFKNTDLQWALDRKEHLNQDFEGAVKAADNALKVYADILDRMNLILELIRDKDPDFKGFLDEKEGE